MSQSSKKILLVDDMPAAIQVTGMLLEKLGYIVDSAASAEDALIKFEQNEYVLIISDNIMDGISGFELLKKIRESSNIPFILTSKYNPSEQKEFFSYPSTDLLEKPFSLKMLKSSIAKLLDSTEQPTR